MHAMKMQNKEESSPIQYQCINYNTVITLQMAANRVGQRSLIGSPGHP